MSLALRVSVVFLLLAGVVPAVAAGPSCVLPSEPSAAPILDDYYYARVTRDGFTYYAQLWRESNGVEGLQTANHYCMAGDVWPADSLKLSVPLAGSGSLPF